MIATARTLHETSSALRDRGLIVDNFAGGGGASEGIRRALGRDVDLAVNHDAAAIVMHEANHPRTRHLQEDVFDVDIAGETSGLPIDAAWFSPDCTHHSRAKGMKPLSKKIRGLAWVVMRWGRQPNRPAVIFLENVREFEDWGPLDENLRPCPDRRGKTFRLFVNRLRGLGYKVEWRSLNAADFGAPTHRRRLFLIARCDGAPIVWPEPTHGPGRAKPWRTAAEIIDWSLPCHSIFLTKEEGRAAGVKRPLAENTMRRIANGVRRYVIDAAQPFIVRTGHWSTITGEGTGFRGQGLDKPLGTVCATNDKAVIVPHVQQFFGGMVGKPLTDPLPTITATDHNALCSATIVGVGGRAGQSAPTGMGAPIGTITAKNDRALVAPVLVGAGGAVYAGKPRRLDQPAGSVMPQSRQAIAAAFLSHFNHGAKQESDVREPLRTVTAGGLHHAEVRAFLIKYYGQGVGQEVGEPLHTVVSRDRFGLVMVEGEPYEIVDIGMRMLTPRELARAQGFPDDYVLTGNNREQVARIGNSVSPVMSEVLVRANIRAEYQELEAA